MKRLAVFASGSGTNFEAIAQACVDGRLDARVALLVCDVPGAKVLERGARFGVETFCYLVIFLIFLLMGVEKFGKFDHDAIVQDQKAAAQAEGRPYISPVEKIRLEEGEEAYQEELKKLEDARKAEEAKLAALSPEARKALQDKEKAVLAEFNDLRKANGRAPLEDKAAAPRNKLRKE